MDKAGRTWMANQEQLDILKQGVRTWNEWREKNHGVQIDLMDADLYGANLIKANLNDALQLHLFGGRWC